MNRFWVIIGMLITQLLYLQAQEAEDGVIEKHFFRDRLIFLFSDNATGKAKLEKQARALNEYPTELMRRKVLIYIVTPQGITYPSGEQHSAEEALELCQLLGVNLQGFTLLFIDLNGQESLRSNVPLPPQKIFQHIDATPLRRSEVLDSLIQELEEQ